MWFVAGFFILSLSQLLAGMLLAEETSRAGISEVLGDGDVLSLTFVIAVPALLAAMLPIISFRSGTSVSDWLDIRPLAPGRVLIWFGYMTALLVAYLIVETLMTRPRIPEWMRATCRVISFNSDSLGRSPFPGVDAVTSLSWIAAEDWSYPVVCGLMARSVGGVAEFFRSRVEVHRT